MNEHSDTVNDGGGYTPPPPDDDLGLDLDDCCRLLVELLEEHPDGLTQEQIERAMDALDQDYMEAMAAYALWYAWRQRAVKFNFDFTTGEIMVSAL